MFFKALLAIGLFSTFAFTANCLHPLNQNLVVNGGFEQSDTSISPWTSTLGEYNIQSPGHESNQAFYSQYKRHTNGTLTQSLDLCEDETYMIEFDYKLHDHSSKFRGNLLNPTIGNLVASYFSSYTYNINRWKHSKHIVVGNEVPDLNFYLQQRCSHCGFSVDNVQVYAITPPIVNSTADDIVSSGDFEQRKGGYWGYWYNDQTCRIASPGYKSNHSALCTATDGINGMGASFDEEGGYGPPTGPYIYSLDYKVVVDDARSNCAVTASTLSGFEQQYYGVIGYDSAFTNNTWYHYSVPIFLAGQYNPYLKITVKSRFIGEPCEVYIDNVSLRPAYFPS